VAGRTSTQWVAVLTNTMASPAAPAHLQGRVLGLTQSVTGIGRLAGPLLAGALFPLAPNFPFLTGAGLCVPHARRQLSCAS
jgi:MFS family permease